MTEMEDNWEIRKSELYRKCEYESNLKLMELRETISAKKDGRIKEWWNRKDYECILILMLKLLVISLPIITILGLIFVYLDVHIPIEWPQYEPLTIHQTESLLIYLGIRLPIPIAIVVLSFQLWWNKRK